MVVMMRKGRKAAKLAAAPCWCEHCGKQFAAKRIASKRHGNRFCSPGCYHAYVRGDARAPYGT